MTLNLNLVTDAYIIQASDRRMVSLVPGVKWINDQANKSVIFNTDDGIFAATFHGIGIKLGERVDLWLARQLAETGAVEVPIADALPLIAESATKWFRDMPSGFDMRHSFVIAGWLTRTQPPRSVCYVVSNFIKSGIYSHLPKRKGEAGLSVHHEQRSARREFDVIQFPTHRGLVGFQPFGMTEAIESSDMELVHDLFKGPISATPDLVEPVLVEVVRRAASRPIGQPGINKDVLSVVLLPTGQRRSTLYSASTQPENFAPLYVWNQQGYNLVVGGGNLTASRDVTFKIGPDLLVGDPGGQLNHGSIPNRNRDQMSMFFLPVKARFKTEGQTNGEDHIKLGGMFWPKSQDEKENSK